MPRQLAAILRERARGRAHHLRLARDLRRRRAIERVCDDRRDVEPERVQLGLVAAAIAQRG
jgi:hypothetical protein